MSDRIQPREAAMSDTTRAPIILTPDAGRAELAVVGESIRVLADAAATGSYEIFLQHGPPGAGPPPHTHPWDEAYYMLEGEMDVLVGDRWIVVRAGDFVHLPRMTPHCFRYRTAGTFVSMTSGAGAARFFGDLAREVPPGPPDVPKLVA